MIIAGELMADKQSREGLVLMMKSIQSDTDFLAWVDYLRLPANGWEGGEEPPELDLATRQDDQSTLFSQIAMASQKTLIPDAHAISAQRATRAATERLLRSLKSFDSSDKSRRLIIEGITGTTKALKKTDLAALRKTAFSPQTVATAARLGQNAISKLYRRSRNLRIPPFAIAAIITYLESRRVCDGEDGFCKPLVNDVASKLDREFYKKILTNDILSGRKDFVGGFENGAAFHMAVTAYYQLSYEAGNIENQPVDIERQIGVQLFNKVGTVETPFGNAYQRRTDIVLSGAGELKTETLVETKSYKRPFDPKRFGKWNLSRGKETEGSKTEDSKAVHKQFFLDRVAAFTNRTDGKIAGDIRWWFHDFNRATIDGYRASEIKQAFEKLGELPSNSDVARASLKILPNQNPSKKLKPKVKAFKLKALLLDKFKSRLFNGVEDALYDELVTNSKHDLIP
jgi:hypothetical protein